MLILNYAARELWDSSKEEYLYTPAQKLILEHSLVSISKWESKYKKSYLSTTNKTIEETAYYIKCMNVSKNEISDETIMGLTSSEQQEIVNYIEDSKTATTINKKHNPSRAIITSEQIYSWMILLNIPSEYQKWHLSRLLMLIEVCEEENNRRSGGGKKMTTSQILAQNAALNAQRKAMNNGKG